MTNAAPYATREPRLDIRRERRYRPVEAGAFHILTRVTAPAVVDPQRRRPPLDLAFVVDRSGSMSGGKLDLARQGVEHALRLLDRRDTVSLVVYDDQVDTLLTQRAFDADARDTATRCLARIRPRGSTDLAGGWLAGCRELAPVADGTRVEREKAAQPICRAILLSDGLANVGMTDADAIATHAAELYRRGISTSTLGVGADYDELLMAQLADAGGGHFHHIEDVSKIPPVFAGELGEMLQVALRDVSIALRVPTGWQAHLLNDLPVEHADGWLTLRLGDLESGAQKSIVWAIDLPAVDHGHRETVDVRVQWRDAEGLQRFEQVHEHAVEASFDTGPADERVEDAIAGLLGARARDEALQLNRSGDYDGAARVLYQYAAEMPRTAAAQGVAYSLVEDARTLDRPASPAAIKRQFARMRNARRSQKDYAE
jgi:Ca-activated chloride channel family protein